MRLVPFVLAVFLIAAPCSAAEEPSKKSDQPSQIRVYVEGAYCMGCSSVLTGALKTGGLKNASKIVPTAGRGYVIVQGEFDHDVNLSALAKEVNAADTPHRELDQPGLLLELFAKLDEESAKNARAALAELKGVDAKSSIVDPKRGVVNVRLTGDGSVSVKDIIAALAEEKIKAEVKADAVRRILGEEKKGDESGE